MDDVPIEERINVIERRLLYVLAMFVGAYVLAGAWILVEFDVVTVWGAGFGLFTLLTIVLIVGIYRHRV
ncbi:hypothetical protein ACFQH2_17390 [Natronoarchaeum sp. GCM10025703]|uniref:hypothetical protein n=1 Tax=unclassified Natronoarchaeum TaxID=2620183 RepID=UPI00361A01DB